MQRRTLEALADAIAKYSGYHNPDSDLYLARNPGGLKAFSANHVKDADGHRVFNSLIDGIQALLYDVELKMTGRSKARLQPSNTLSDLAVAYDFEGSTAQAWSRFLRQALRDEAINSKTPLSHFLDSKDN